MGLWLANPVEPRLLTIMEALFNDLKVRDRICWIVHRGASVGDIPEGDYHIWDRDSKKWEKIAQADLKASRGRLPRRLFGLGIRRGLDETKLYLRTQGRRDNNLHGDLVLGAYTFVSGLKDRFEKGEIDGAFVWNQWGYENRALAELCRAYGKPCWYLEQGFLPKTICFSRQGLYDEAHHGHDWEHEPVDDLDDRVIEAGLERYKGSSVIDGVEEASEKALERLKSSELPLVLVAGQLDGDSNIIFRSPGCSTNRDLLMAVCRAPDVRVLFKPHPYDRKLPPEMPEKVGAASLELARADVKLHQLIELCDVLVTRNSTSGIEAILYDKPVIHTGRVIYHVGSLATATRTVDMPGMIRHVLAAPAPQLKDGSWRSDKWRFFRWLIRKHLYFPYVPSHPQVFRSASIKRIVGEFNGGHL